MRVAVTGATGFIGRHVLTELSRRPGIETVAASREERDSSELPHGIQYVPLDIAVEPESAHEQLGQPDVLIHLAWDGLPNYMSLHHFETELPTQYRFLRAMVASGLSSLLVTGTCYEYGMLSGELTEKMAAPPANPYAYAKVALHRQLRFLQAEQPFALTWARLFYMWGEGQAATSIYPLLRAAVARGEVTFPMSKGEQLRDYLPAEEVARLLVTLALQGEGADLVNVCSGQPISIRTLVESWIVENGWRITPELGRYPYPSYEPLAFWGSRAKLEAILNRQV